jgi:CheY-like chemotaxis protein
VDSEKKNINVLLADDDPSDRRRFQIALRLAYPNVKVESLVNGIQLIEYLNDPEHQSSTANKRPDLIITDLYMPFAGGLQVLKQIRKNQVFKDIPIYVFSSNNDRIIQSKMLEFGATEFHQKTPDATALQGIINQIMQKYAINAAA